LAGFEIEVAGGDTATPRNLAKRLRLIERIAGPLEGVRSIDCGCGGGEYVRALRGAGAVAFGVEYQMAKLLGEWPAAGSRTPWLAAADIQSLPFPDGAFDLAIVNEVLEHVPDDSQGLREVHRVLAPGGMLVVFSPNRLYPFETHGVFLKRSGRKLPPSFPGVPYLPIRLGRVWLRYWARNYWPGELRRLVARAGFRVVDHTYVWQTFENISGQQPGWMTRSRFVLRAVANALERIPGIRAFGVSQAILARREPPQESP
jgi:SAM-dependent methyltransferase